MTGPVIPTKDRSIHPGLRFPFEWVNRFGWRPQVAGGGKMHRVGLSALAQPRLIKGDQPYLRPEINPATRCPGLPPAT